MFVADGEVSLLMQGTPIVAGCTHGLVRVARTCGVQAGCFYVEEPLRDGTLTRNALSFHYYRLSPGHKERGGNLERVRDDRCGFLVV